MHDTVLNHIRRHLNLPKDEIPDLNELRRTEWSRLFERLMRNRLIIGAMRYGGMKKNRDKGTRYDVVGSAIKRLENYKKDGNLEHLVDVANLCMVEFDHPSHRNPTWDSIDDGEHVTLK